MTDNCTEDAHHATIRVALEAIENLSLAGQEAEARSFLVDLWPFLTEGVAMSYDPQTINLFAGIALGYTKLGMRDAAIRSAKHTLILSPTDMVGHAIAPLTDRILIARHFMHFQQHQKALELLECIRTFTPESEEEVDFYFRVLRHYEAEKARIRLLPPPRSQGTLLNLTVWGEAYIDKFLRFALPSLLAPGNVPALAKAGPVIFDIYTTEAGRERMESSPGIDAIKQFAQVDFSIIPEAFFAFKGTYSTGAPDRLYLSGSQMLSVMKAKLLGADLSFVVTEGLYSNNHFQTAKAHLKAGYKAVVMISLRALDGALESYLDATGAKNDDCIAIDADHLVRYATDNLMPQLRRLFLCRNNKPVYQDVIALYFKTDDGFAAHTFQISPALIGHDIIPDTLEFDYHTSDTRLLAELAAGHDPAEIYKVIHEPGQELFVVDLASQADADGRKFGEFPVTIEQSVQSALKWCTRETDLDYFTWAYRQRFSFRCDPTGLPDNDCAEADAVSDFIRRFDEFRSDTLTTIDFFRRTPGAAG